MKQDDVQFVSLLSRDSIVDGTRIITPSDFKIAGKVDQHIICGGKLIVSEYGKVSGNLKAGDMVIEGHVRGNIWVNGTLKITRTATLVGSVSASKLIMEEGALCQINTTIDEKAPERFDNADPVENRSDTAQSPKNPLTKHSGKSDNKSDEKGKIPLSDDEVNDELQTKNNVRKKESLTDRFW